MPVLQIGQASSKLPIVQGGMAIRISTEDLAAAVYNQGCVGTIGASGMRPEELQTRIRNAKRLIDPKAGGLLAVNIMRAVTQFWQLLEVSIEEKVDIAFVGAGLPEVQMYERANGTQIVPAISRPGVLDVLVKRMGVTPPAVVLESGQAGGHLGTKTPQTRIWELLPQIAEKIGRLKKEGYLERDIPVIAAGGILTGNDICRALSLGASGVQLGTRFALSEESNACDLWKQTLVAARKTAIIQSPVGLPGRAVESTLVRKIAAGQAPKVGSLQRCVNCLEKCRRDYCIFAALEKAQETGDQHDGLFFAGARVGEINDVLPVALIIDRLKQDYAASCRSLVSDKLVVST